MFSYRHSSLEQERQIKWGLGDWSSLSFVKHVNPILMGKGQITPTTYASSNQVLAAPGTLLVVCIGK